MPSEPRRLGDTSKAVSERLLSLITRTPPPAVRVQNRLRLQRFGPIDGPEVRGRYSTQCAVRETEVESLCGLLGKGPLPGAEPTGRNDPLRTLEPCTEAMLATVPSSGGRKSPGPSDRRGGVQPVVRTSVRTQSFSSKFQAASSISAKSPAAIRRAASCGMTRGLSQGAGVAVRRRRKRQPMVMAARRITSQPPARIGRVRLN